MNNNNIPAQINFLYKYHRAMGTVINAWQTINLLFSGIIVCRTVYMQPSSIHVVLIKIIICLLWGLVNPHCIMKIINWVTYTKQCYDYNDMTLHDLKLDHFLYTTVWQSLLKGYLSRVHFRSSKEGSHPEQLQLLKSHLIILN